jgi:hypothetical protein
VEGGHGETEDEVQHVDARAYLITTHHGSRANTLSDMVLMRRAVVPALSRRTECLVQTQPKQRKPNLIFASPADRIFDPQKQNSALPCC